MKKYSITVFAVVSCLVILCVSGARAGKNNRGKSCLNCHLNLKQKSLEEKAHGPVQKEDCIACHNPHTSRHKGLLNEKSEEICYTCHKKDETDEFSRPVIHSPVEEGKCTACHDPHYSANKNLLIKKGRDLCFECHSKESISSGKEVHPLITKGECGVCHEPHSSYLGGLMKQRVGDLCNTCHDAKEEPFIAAHRGYSIGNSDCSSCHNPHSSDNRALVRTFIHQPVIEKKCADCHNPADSENPLLVKISGVELCYECHGETKKDFEKINSHLIGNRENSCLNCHNPHASDNRFLLNKKEKKVCFKCHSDTKDRINARAIISKHPEWENCSLCHSPHGSDYPVFLIAKQEESCSTGECHKTESSFSHPIGPEALDPRNNKQMNCLTCHNPMGTGYKNNLRLDPDAELCEQCHEI